MALDDDTDHTPLAVNTFRVKTEFGSPRADPSRHSYGATLFAATSFNAAPFPSVGSPNPFKGNGSKGSPFASSPVPNTPPAGGQTDYDSQTFDHAFGGAHFPSAGHAEAAVVQQSHGQDGAGRGMAAALMMMPTIGDHPNMPFLNKSPHRCWHRAFEDLGQQFGTYDVASAVHPESSDSVCLRLDQPVDD